MRWEPPTDDPPLITKANYYDKLRQYLDLIERDLLPHLPPVPPNPPRCDPNTPARYAALTVPAFLAAWKVTGNSSYVDKIICATHAYCAWLDKDTQAHLPTGSFSWADYYMLPDLAYFVIALQLLADTPLHDQISARLAPSLTMRATRFPLYSVGVRGDPIGPYNRIIAAAHFYELALRLDPNLPNASVLRPFIESVWNAWWPYRDVEEDDSPGYVPTNDLLVLHTWCLLRGVEWWHDPLAADLWRHYCHLITNDGTMVGYGGGDSPHGGYFPALRNAELTASLTGDGRLKWLAHRAFWNGRDRIDALQAGIGYTCAFELALAYLLADDTVQETPPEAGITLTRRRLRERQPNVQFYTLQDAWQPSKVVFRSGAAEHDHTLVVQAGNMAGHGHPDAGAILHYSGGVAPEAKVGDLRNWSYFLCHGCARLDYYMEHHNLLVLQNPLVCDSSDTNLCIAEKAGSELTDTSESTSVPVSGTAPDASYARIHIEEHPQAEIDAGWQTMQALFKSAQRGHIVGPAQVPARAIGYKNWPVRLDRSVLFVNNRFALVRDCVTFTRQVTARLGQNWVTQALDDPVSDHDWTKQNWVNSCISSLFGQTLPTLMPIDAGASELLIWLVPQANAALDVVDGPRCSWYGCQYINLPTHIWAPRTATWSQGQIVGFATLLYPHEPAGAAAAAALAGQIQTLQHDESATTLSVTTNAATYLLLVNNTLVDRPLDPFIVDAEAAVLTLVQGAPARLSLWQVSHVVFEGRVLLAGKERIDISTTTFGPGVLRTWIEPTPIRWTTTKRGAPEATVTLTVHCVDSATNQPVGALAMASDGVNNFAIPTNTPHRVTLHKVPSREGRPGDPIVYDDPQVQVIALGYPPVIQPLT